MLHSMTGFGQSNVKGHGFSFSIEVRSFNSRYLDIFLKIPEGIAALEDRIKKFAQEKVRRGRVNLVITEEEGKAGELKLDLVQAKRYLSTFRTLKKKLRIPGELRLELLLNLPQIFRVENRHYADTRVWPLLRKGMEKAFDSLIDARLKEGREIYKSLLKHLDVISISLRAIEEEAPAVVSLYKEKLENTLKKFLPELNLNHPRLVEEITLFAARVDITEEVSRLKAHLSAFHNAMQKPGLVGRRLDFIVQEMGREVNTLSSKANSFSVSSRSIVIKEALEKLREQIQNVE